MIAVVRGVGITTLAAVGLICGSALAMNPYTVHITVPSTVKRGQTYDLRVYGFSANTSKLAVFRDKAACATTAAAEQAHPGAVLFIAKQVTGNYSVTQSPKAASLGKHYVCAYLTGLPPQSLPRAHAMASYTVTP